MFKIGDIVRAKLKPDGEEYYSITHSGVSCRVSYVEWRYMGVFVIGNGSFGPFRVKCCTFELETVDLENK